MPPYILSLDQGTTSSRALLFDSQGSIKGMAQSEFPQYFPKSGWVEHNPMDIWQSQLEMALKVLKDNSLTPADIAAIGITNQRETTMVWDRSTGKPIYNAIVWQDRRTASNCDKLSVDGHANMIREKTGLVIDAYFSGTKVQWILDNVKGARAMARKGQLAFGTVDSWLVWNLTNGKLHITDVTNASRTMLFNIHTLEWDNDLLELFGIPRAMMPTVKQSSEVFAETDPSVFGGPVPIAGIAGDQQAALFGQMCVERGMVKNTYGTGCFILMNTGDKPFESRSRLVTTIAWSINGRVTYALEGSIFVAGAAVQWLRDGLGIISSSAEIESLASSVDSSDGVMFVPALAGLGAPHWDQYARGMLIGVNRGTTKAHIARATLEGIALQSMDVLAAMENDTGISTKELRVDGGASVNNLLMQIQADAISTPVVRPQVQETTALGAAYLAGLAVGYWDDIGKLQRQWEVDRIFTPKLHNKSAQLMKTRWMDAVKRAGGWGRSGEL